MIDSGDIGGGDEVQEYIDRLDGNPPIRAKYVASILCKTQNSGEGSPRLPESDSERGLAEASSPSRDIRHILESRTVAHQSYESPKERGEGNLSRSRSRMIETMRGKPGGRRF